MRRVAILDYGMGNLRSVEKAFEHVGVRADVTNDHERIRAADGVVLPGVGAFPKAMERIRELRLDEIIRERLDAGVPLLGICLGLQLLFDSSTELGGAEGLGLVPGRVDRLETGGLKLPQIGWNGVEWRRESPVIEGLPDGCAMYHVHTYAPRPADGGDVLGTAHYGEEFVTAVQRGSVYGVQFHPEKSGPHGLALLAGFARSRVAA
ncbi:MAG: imidazole glycerol-phosphate synthase subunit HisH [Thermoleophilaceae bacterium]|nr:imidazole glycerol-phosphate synthase subunit HisH [Thermoleophilaceae bacterium]